MDRECATSYTELEDQIKKNEEKIKELEGQLSASRGHNKVLEEEMESLKTENLLLNEKLKEKDDFIDSMKRNIIVYELFEEHLCIAQLCTSLQENICEIVLEDYYDEISNKNTKYMQDYIKNQIENEVEQEAARERWELLKKEMNWNPYWIITLGPLRRERNEMANPLLTEERIKNAKLKMEKEGKLTNNMVKAVDALTKMWKLSNSKLQKQPSVSPPADNTKFRPPVAESNKTNENEILEQKLHRKEDELRLMKEELKLKNKEIEELTERQSKFEEDRKKLEARIEELEKDVKLLKEKLEQVTNQFEGNNRRLYLGSMCDKLQSNFYRHVFSPYDFSKFNQSYQARYIENDINNGWYGLTNRKKKRQAKKRWDNLKKTLGWDPTNYVPVIKQMKYNRLPLAHPPITKEKREYLEESATVMKDENVFDPHRFDLVKQLIEMWSKTEDLV